MNIIFNEKPGEILDLFISLWVINNSDYDKEQLKNLSFTRNCEMEKKVDSIIDEKRVTLDGFQMLFCKNADIGDFFTLEDVWNFDNLGDYLNFLYNMNEDEIRKKIVNIIVKEDKNFCEKFNNIDEIAKNNENVLSYIKDKELNYLVKREIYYMLNQKNKYLKEFINFINSYKKIYEEIEILRKDEMSRFNIYVEDSIKNKGIGFLNNVTSNAIDFNKFTNIYVTTSAISGIIVSSLSDNDDCYIMIGSHIEEMLKKVYGKNQIENYLSIFKGISDNTRYSIIKLLLKKNYYGLELAKVLGITSATVFYHMNFLILLGVVDLEKKDHKAYYSLNKDKLRKSIEFLSEDLEL